MKNLIIRDDQISLDFAVIEGEDFNSLIYAEQKGVGQNIDAMDEKGNTLTLRIDSIIDGRMVVQITEMIPPAKKPRA
ncbi:MAG: hypothetical protein A2Y33_08970 [Spirochaetes bacterium GWF1_51_8]|nr:MAG: hypothetical protein A2Y33_08970 [Spirochaetes bacterium GWF1_51_8]